MKKKLRLTAKFRVALGQVGLLVSIILAALMLGLVPDRDGAVRQGRKILAEAVAINASGMMTSRGIQRLEVNLSVIVERNDDLLSAAVRRLDAFPAVVIGDHHWQEMEDEYSTDTQIRVPILSGEDQWGQLELRFTPVSDFGGFAFHEAQVMPFVIFMSVSSFIVFYLYLGKMLKLLDPSSAIPPRVRAALDTMAGGLLVIDLKGQIVLANSSFAETVGKEVDDLLGWKTHELAWEASDGSALSPDDAPWAHCLLTGEAQRNATVQLLDDQQKRRIFMVNCCPVLAASGKHGGVLISFDDVTQLEEKKDELGKARQEAEEANQAKSEFLANMSHEIRTPMNAILGFTDILRRGYGRSTKDPRKYLNTIHSSGKHLLELINDILDLSKVEAGKLEVERVNCAPHLIVREVVQILGVKANEKGISLTYEADGPIPESISSDPSRLRQIITNLVGNAIKFTESGGVRVLLQLISEEQPKLRIDIRDSGIGLSPEQQERIFEPFSQADSSVTRRFGGTGLGLTISRQFAEALGGGITVQSKVGMGSVFSVTIDTGPLEGIPELDPADLYGDEEQLVEQQTSWSFNSERVLVVDDGPENRELVALVLEEVGLQIEEAENGQIGVDMALEQRFDLILMDIQMPVMDGYVAARLLREKGVTTPIYALTAHAMKGFERKCLEAGYTGYLTKPIDVDVLLETLGQVLSGERRDVESAGEILPRSQPGTATDSARIHSTLSVDNPRMAAVVNKFGKRLDEELAAMDDAWKARDMQRLAERAHWLKGSGGTVGFAAFTAPATRLENLAKQEALDEIESTLAELRELSNRIQVPEAPAEAIHGGVHNSTAPSGTPLVSKLPMDIPRFRGLVEKFDVRLRDKLNDMEQAWKDQNFSELAELAHWLKGSGGTVGFDEFTAPAAALDRLAKEHTTDGVEALLEELRGLANRIQLPDDQAEHQTTSRHEVNQEVGS